MSWNRLRLAAAYLRRDKAPGGFPAVVGIESTNNCNLDCVMCPRQEMTRPVADIERPLYEKAIDQLAGKTEFIWLQDYGEPFLNKEIFTMIRYARERGLKVGISTNGTVLTDKIIEGIFASGLDYLIFAIDGATPETYEKIRVGAKYEKVAANARRFLEKKVAGKHKIFTVVQCIYMEATSNEVRIFRRQWDLPGVDAVRIRQLTYSGKGGKFDNLTTQKPCYWLWSNPHIKNDGTVVPCCQDVNSTLALGNIKDQSLDAIWSGEKMQEIRALHLAGKAGEIPLCRNCNMVQPAAPLILAAAIPSYLTVNRLVPRVESFLSYWRFR
jgi:radical SAM protein with 4Fe4S-binding SPASM domain